MNVLEFLPSWRVLKAIGGSKTIAMAGLFPFVGYLVVANDQFTDILRLITDQPDSLEEIQLRLTQIYFGMLALSIGVLLYRVLCPAEISEFQDRYHYMEKEMAIATPSRVHTIQASLDGRWKISDLCRSAELVENINEAIRFKLDDDKIKDLGFSGANGNGLKSLKAYQSESGIPLAQLLNTYYDYRNTDKWAIRLIASAMFAFGYFKLALPALMVAYALIRD